MCVLIYIISSPTYVVYRYHLIVKARYKKLPVRWRMDLIEENMERTLNILEAIKFAAESWENFQWGDHSKLLDQ